MNKTNAIKNFWEEFCLTNSEINAETPYQIWHFGNTSEMAQELAGLVLQKKKTATASLVEFNEKNPEHAPVENGYSVVTDFENNPLCIVQTTEIRQVTFTEVDAQFASDEGEGNQSLEYWREVHRNYFSKEAANSGVKFDEKTLICCERFRLLYPQK